MTRRTASKEMPLLCLGRRASAFKASLSASWNAVSLLGCPNEKTEGQVREVRLAARAWLDRDFILIFSELPHASMGLASWDILDAGLGVVMTSFSPKFPEQPRRFATMKILVDCSGSMTGDSIQVARRALHGILRGLVNGERFSLRQR
ncbi:MAG: hypothetical protein Q8K87_09685 [Hydrogenophaga sp.]|nr:hypothetical protein [Hydrogenophaga sp.]